MVLTTNESFHFRKVMMKYLRILGKKKRESSEIFTSASGQLTVLCLANNWPMTFIKVPATTNFFQDEHKVEVARSSVFVYVVYICQRSFPLSA